MSPITNRIAILQAMIDQLEGHVHPAMDLYESTICSGVKLSLAEATLEHGQHLLDKGFCQVFPIDDHQYYLRLLFIKNGKNATSTDLTLIEFEPRFFELFNDQEIKAAAPFQKDFSHSHQFNPCHKLQSYLTGLIDITDDQTLTSSLNRFEFAIKILQRSIDLITVNFNICVVPACRFLSSDTERDKIFEAQRILDQSIGQTISIKALSKMVAMNECYLKKGFKTIVGKSIHEYQQHLRIVEAKVLLQEKGYNVTEASKHLGYSSIAHFSTAFKKATGLNPCDLLK